MKLYYVTYDYLIGGKYRPQQTRFFAKNAKEACKTVKNNYWEHVDMLCDKHHCTVKTARKMTHWPFHINAKAM